MLPQENFEFRPMRVLLRSSETTITTQDLWPLESKLGDSSSGIWLFLGAPSESGFVFEALSQNCLLRAAVLSALCLQYTKQ